MAKFNTEASLDDKVNQLHECLEDLKSQSLAYAIVSTKERKALRAGHLSIARRVKAMNTHISNVEDSIDTLTDIAKSSAQIANSVDGKLDKINSTAWKFILTIVTTVIAAGIVGVCGLAYQASVNHIQITQSVQHPNPKTIP